MDHSVLELYRDDFPVVYYNAGNNACYLDFDILPEERERADRGIYTFYALWDSIKAVRKDLEMLEGDKSVVDAIYAANEVRRKNSTLTTE